MVSERVSWSVWKLEKTITGPAEVGSSTNPSNDPNSPFYIHPNDYPRQLHTNETLNEGIYADWSRDIIYFLFAKNMTDFINSTLEQPKEGAPELTAWQPNDTITKGWLIASMEKN